MADNFNMKQFLMENKLGAYSRIKENSLTEARKPDFIIPANDAYDLDEEAENFENILNNADIMAKCKAGIGEVEVYLTDKTDLSQAKQVLEDEGYQVGYNEIDEAKNSISKEEKIQVIKEWIWYTCDEGQAKDDINKYNKMVDMYFADKDDVTKQDFKNIWNKVIEKWGVGDTGADSEGFYSTWEDIQTGTLVNPGQVYEAKEKSNKQKLIDAGYSESDAEDFADEFEQGGSKVPQKVKDILTGKGKKEESLNEYEEPYYYIKDGVCYRATDEGYVDEVDMSYCRAYAEGKEEDKETVEEAVALKLKGYYQILDPGMNDWQDDFQYMGKVAGGSSAGEVGEHMFVAPDAPGSFIFVSIPEADLDTMVKPSMSEGKETVEEAGMFATKANINPELVDKIERFVKGVSKAYEYSIDDAYTNIMSVLKSGLSKKEESLNEMLEPHVYERMYNLSNVKAQQAMIKAAEILMNDLTAEGFEVPEIREFFTQLISNDI